MELEGQAGSRQGRVTVALAGCLRSEFWVQRMELLQINPEVCAAIAAWVLLLTPSLRHKVLT